MFRFRGSAAVAAMVAICGTVGLTPARAQGQDEPYRWRNVEIVGGGFVPGVLFHPKQRDLIYARTDIGGIYRWNPTTKRWLPLTDQFGAKDWNLYGGESIGLDPNDPDRLYVAAGTYINSWAGNGAVLRSRDRGNHWERTDMPFKMGGNWDGRSIGERLAVDPNEGRILFFGSRQDGLWRSEDHGATWAPVKSFPASEKKDGVGIGFIVFDPRTGKSGKATTTLYAGTSNAEPLLRSTDGGATWAALPGQPTGFVPHHLRLMPSGILYVAYTNAPGPNGVSDGAVWKYDTQTLKWTNITPVRPGSGGQGNFGYAGLSVDAAHPETVVVSTIDKWSSGDDVFRSTDGGATWKSVKANAERDSDPSPFLNFGEKTVAFGHWIGSVEIDPFDPNRILYVTGATLWGTEDATAMDRSRPTHWKVWAQGIEETAVIDLVSPPVGAHLVSGLGDIGGFTHDDLTISPRHGMHTNPLLSNTTSLAIADAQPSILVRVGTGGARSTHGAISTDMGNTWKPFPAEPAGSKGGGKIALSSDGTTILWHPDGAGASVSGDGGATWKACAITPGTICADSRNSAVFYATDTTTRHLLVSEDRGITFAARGEKLPEGDLKLRPAPERGGDLWLSAGNSGLFHSTDGGRTFIKISAVEACNAMGFGKSASGQKYPALYLSGTVGGKDGIFRSGDTGATWRRINDDVHQYGSTGQVVIGDPRIYGRVYVGTNGRGILVADPVSTRVGAR